MSYKRTEFFTTTKPGKVPTATENHLTCVVGYIRVSTEGQAQEGVSLDAQRAKLNAYALAGYRLVTWMGDHRKNHSGG